ncbi:hypothetical protein BJ978_001667 [Agromyces terreus]|uniref:DUF7144 domain-containing protein n=1 Tax=Agromyces terreus TaxID=424795 RepID=A0A9X2KC33_9MICO|nr:hypothetical protein [Agromyces terreus]MCP2370991.1 hypothetical protein [Agromyces terreus]
MAQHTARPAGVTIVAVIAWISGAIDVVVGTIMLFQATAIAVDPQWGGAGAVYTSAIVSIILGLITIIVAGGLLGGNTAARLIVTVVQVLSIISSLFVAVANMGNPIGEWFSILVSLIVVILLWTKAASQFFRA